MNFSERYGCKPVREIIQLDSMDMPLRNSLWNLLTLHVWNDYTECVTYNLSASPDHEKLCRKVWEDYFKDPLDRMATKWGHVLSDLRQYFFCCKWHEVYSFIEFVAGNYRGRVFHENFTKRCNVILEREMSAYRFVGGIISQITEQVEVTEIEEAIVDSASPIRTHLKRSLELLSDRESPDYRNSIKESISSVESLVRLTTGSDKSSLGQLLGKLETDISLHPALKNAFSNLYGYTSDENGIRHAITESENTDFNDAKFMLVVCCAFINFVNGKV